MNLFTGQSPLTPRTNSVRGGFVEFEGEPHYRIENVDRMDPFFMTVVSGSDHWMFVSSRGGLTAGRRDSKGALFPYTTDDRVHDSSGRRGPRTVIFATRGENTYRWEPWLPLPSGLYAIRRNLYKNVAGTRLVFEEVNEDLGLTFRFTWTTGERFGFQRRVRLQEDKGEDCRVSILDGLLDVMPASVDPGMQQGYSTLVDAYKRTEACEGTSLALFRLSSIPVDRAEPSEALAVNTIWREGLEQGKLLLSERQLDAFREGGSVESESEVRGIRGAYLIQAELDLPASGAECWSLVGEVEQDSAQAARLQRMLQQTEGLGAELRQDELAGTRALEELVARADGLQCSGSLAEDARHFANTLFNIMRGGVFEAGGLVPSDDVRAYLAEVAPALEANLEDLPPTVTRAELLDRAGDDVDLRRVLGEYLPLLFSRRHGDPSRPWNAFSIEIRGEGGKSPYAYQGNWRDIFQNWEALCASFPAYYEAAVSRFVNSSTADGYNPYRVTRSGFEWEVPDPDDPWAFIGYWGDHQLIYLVRLLEPWQEHDRDALSASLLPRRFVFADVPYRIRGFDDICANPRDTITYDTEHAAAIDERVATEGQEGRLLRDRSGAIHRVSLAEKLLVPTLVKLTNLVPEIGLWLTTQRPEWNDANNALVGTGASVVTLAHLSQALALYIDLFEGVEGDVTFSSETAQLFAELLPTLSEEPRPLSPTERMAMVEKLGRAGERQRFAVYSGGPSGEFQAVAAEELAQGLRAAKAWIDHSLHANRRDDGLFHAYNLLELSAEGADVRRLPAMLEGQVSVLGAGLLDSQDSAELVKCLLASDLFRADQESFLLYPDRALPRFFDANRLPAEAREQSALIRALLAEEDTRLVLQGEDGVLHFAAPLRNSGEVAEALDDLESGPHGALVREERDLILDLYERTFDHNAFTGRSGTFYGYEGLGCIYWHQVSKLLLAVRELCDRDPKTAELEELYAKLRLGLGTHKSPENYGAFPTDPYSHTPSFAGAQQPGMTGQVKEDFLARMKELGISVRGGRLHLGPSRGAAMEFHKEPATFTHYDADGERCLLELPAGTLALTAFQVPVILHEGGEPRVVVTDAKGRVSEHSGLALDAETSRRLFHRDPSLQRIDVYGR